jgi:ribosomal protein S18 acetylase RimI-like enzyme
MVDAALNDARDRGFLYAATNWRVTNRRAARFWTTYGFEPTYERLHRTIGTF